MCNPPPLSHLSCSRGPDIHEPYCFNPSRARRPVNGAARSIRCAPVLAVPPKRVTDSLSAPALLVLSGSNSRTHKGEQGDEQRETGRLHARITDKIIADLEQGVRTWMKPWNAGNTAGRITRPATAQRRPILRDQHPDALGRGDETKGFTAPIWMTFKQARNSMPMSARARRAPSSFMPTPSPHRGR